MTGRTVEAALEEFVRAVVREELAAAAPEPAPPAQEWFTVGEAADYLRFSRRTLERLVAGGEVRSSTVGRCRIVGREWLDEYATAREEAEPTASPRRRESLQDNGGSHAR
jgi:excisionase family DNA binding protein